MNFRQIALAEFAGVAALRQEFCGRGMAEMQPSARVGFVRCRLSWYKEAHRLLWAFLFACDENSLHKHTESPFRHRHKHRKNSLSWHGYQAEFFTHQYIETDISWYKKAHRLRWAFLFACKIGCVEVNFQADL
jgi:hypothetical protein